MTSSTEGRPFCVSSGKYLTEKNKNRRLTKTCRECSQIRYIGCPGFKHGATIVARDVIDWVDWWYYDIPIKDNPSKEPQKTQGEIQSSNQTARNKT